LLGHLARQRVRDSIPPGKKSARRFADPSQIRHAGVNSALSRLRLGILPEGEFVLIFPAIDLRGGQCVRLRQGDYTQETVFGADPAAVARQWVEQGAQWLHVVDLDGARAGKPVNGDSIRCIVEAAGVPCQLGGGLRSEADIETALSWGIRRVVLGTAALKAPGWFQGVCERWPGQVVLGIDAKGGRVAVEGWLEVSDLSAPELARRCAAWPVAAIVYTDI